MTVEDAAHEKARRIREDAERRAARAVPRPTLPGAVPRAGTTTGLSSLPPGWSIVRGRALRGRDVSVWAGPGGIVVVSTDPAECAASSALVRAAAGRDAGLVVPVVCAAHGTQVPDGTLCCPADQLARTLTTRPAVLSSAQVAAAVLRIGTLLDRPDPPGTPLSPTPRWRIALTVLVVLLVMLVLAAAAVTMSSRLGGI